MDKFEFGESQTPILSIRNKAADIQNWDLEKTIYFE